MIGRCKSRSGVRREATLVLRKFPSVFSSKSGLLFPLSLQVPCLSKTGRSGTKSKRSSTLRGECEEPNCERMFISKTNLLFRRRQHQHCFLPQGFCPYGESNRMADILFKTPEGGLHAMLHAPYGTCRSFDVKKNIHHQTELFSMDHSQRT